MIEILGDLIFGLIEWLQKKKQGPENENQKSQNNASRWRPTTLYLMLIAIISALFTYLTSVR